MGSCRLSAARHWSSALKELLPAEEHRRLEGLVRDFIRNYRQTLLIDRRHLVEEYQYVDIARKVVGVGSVGTRAWIILLVGRDESDPLFLQIKEAQASVLEPYVRLSQLCQAWRTGGQRAALDPVGARHLSGLGPHPARAKTCPRITTCDSCGTGRCRRRLPP